MHDITTEKIIACCIKVHSVLGTGYVEKVYGRAFRIELDRNGIPYEHEKNVPIFYEGQHIARHVLDLVVDGTVVVELKAARDIGPLDYKQLRSYLKAGNLAVGLLINFGSERVDVRRVELKANLPEDKTKH